MTPMKAMEVNKLQIKLYEFCHPAKDSAGMEFRRQADFLVDGEQLSHALGIADARPWFGSTLLDTIPPPSMIIDRFLAKVSKEPKAQGSAEPERFVLYTCHSDVAGGEEQAGAISCILEREDDLIRWRDIRSEGALHPVKYPDLVFKFDEYQEELEDYIDRNPTT